MMDYAYVSIEETSRAALIEAYKCGEGRRECGGVIYRLHDGLYVFSEPITSDKPFGVDLGPAYAMPMLKPGELVADYHNHICSVHNRPFAEFFSFGDAILNKGLHTIGYMLDGCTGLIHRFDPAQDDIDDEEVDFKSGKVIYLTIGHVSGWIDLRKYAP